MAPHPPIVTSSGPSIAHRIGPPPQWRRRRRAAVLLLLIVPLPVGAGSPDEPAIDDGWRVERFEWRGPEDDARRLVLVNRYGDIRARTAKNRSAEVLGLIQHDGTQGAQPSVRVSETDRDILVGVEMPPADHQGDADRRRVDISVLVPPGMSVSMLTEDGLIEAKNLRSDVAADSTDGKINISTSGAVDVDSRFGDVSVLFTASAWQSEPHIETQTGQVDALIPANADARIDAATSGHITSDYSMTIDYQRERDRKRATVVLGEGKGLIRIESARGDVRLLRSPLAPAAAGD